MNAPIVRIYALILLLLGSLVYFTSKWAVFDADALEERTENRRPLIAEQQIRRGSITTNDGVLVAESLPQGGGRNPVYVRRYPQGSLFGHPVGYSFVDVNRSEFELAENDLLVGEENEFASIVDQLRGITQEGADVTLTIDADAQRVATQGLESAAASSGVPNIGGGLVAIEPDTGAVRAMASAPGFDPNTIEDEGEYKRLNRVQSAPLFNRPTQGVYPPGSTMKVVTAAAALDSGEIDPDTVINADSPKEIGGVDLENAGGEPFGDISATDALTNSVNTYWAQVGERLGNDTYFEYMERFGFLSDPELDYPADAMAPSGVYEEGRLLDADAGIDIGRVAIGQERLLTSPLQMAEVAATVANGGALMQPTLLQEAKDPDGRTIEELDPDEQERVIDEETAAQLTEMMTRVTQEGTASNLTVEGVEFAGKTGTAEINIEDGINQPWFIGFAPAQDPQIAVAATIERCTGCFGGEVAGPIATQVMEALLR